ncbi:MAG: hypothetical protein ACI834_000500 [Colwellia sp.]|jgi:hypothetical protein
MIDIKIQLGQISFIFKRILLKWTDGIETATI